MSPFLPVKPERIAIAKIRIDDQVTDITECKAATNSLVATAEPTIKGAMKMWVADRRHYFQSTSTHIFF